LKLQGDLSKAKLIQDVFFVSIVYGCVCTVIGVICDSGCVCTGSLLADAGQGKQKATKPI